MKLARCLAPVALSLLTPALTLASEAGGESNLFAGDIGNAVWTLLIFLLVIVVLGKFAWGPLLETLQRREETIRESLESARRDREAAETRLAEYERKLEAAKAEATAIVDEGRRDAEVVKRQIEQQARDEAEKIVGRARREIQIAQQTAVREIYVTSARLATDLASRIIGREVEAEDHERLIAESIDSIDRLETN